MFYSQWLLSKKGPLGIIWVAAHCHKSLKKTQVKQTDISSSVERILRDDVPVVTYRILAYLLLGVVRIYSKKVDYLFHDCCHVLTNIRDFAVGKKAKYHIETMCASYRSITLPERFELDAFNLEVTEDSSCTDNVRPREEIMLEDGCGNEGIRLDSLDNFHLEEHAANSENCFMDYCPVKDVYSPHLMEKRLGVSPSGNLSNWEASMEKLRGSRFSAEECLDPMVLDEGVEEPKLVSSFHEEHRADGNQMKSPETEMNIREEEEPPELVRSFDENQHLTKFPEMTSESEKLQISEARPLSISVDVTPESKFPDASDAPTPEFIAVRTPATREHARISKKRKCLYDDSVVFSNKVLKQCINDSSPLVCRRKKAPHTALLAWKTCRISNLPQSFLEPLIPCSSLDLRSFICKETLKTPEPVETVTLKIPEGVEAVALKISDGVETVALKTLEAFKTVEISGNVDMVATPIIHRSPEQTPIAPATPVTQATSLRFYEDHGIAKSDRVGPATSLQIIEKDFDIILMDEEINSCGGVSQDEHKWSERTRAVARYLHRNFVNRKEQEKDEVMNLLQALKGKTKKESARLFYEILVLKSGDFVDVKQDNAYDDILVMETSNKLKQFL